MKIEKTLLADFDCKCCQTTASRMHDALQIQIIFKRPIRSFVLLFLAQFRWLNHVAVQSCAHDQRVLCCCVVELLQRVSVVCENFFQFRVVHGSCWRFCNIESATRARTQSQPHLHKHVVARCTARSPHRSSLFLQCLSD